MAKNANMEDFVLSLGWDDKKAVKGLKDFIAKVKAQKISMTTKFDQDAKKAIDQKEKYELERKNRLNKKQERLDEAVAKSKIKLLEKEKAIALQISKEIAKEERAQARAEAKAREAQLRREQTLKNKEITTKERAQAKAKELEFRREQALAKEVAREKRSQERAREVQLRREQALQRSKRSPELIRQKGMTFMNSENMRAVQRNNMEDAQRYKATYLSLLAKNSKEADERIRRLNQSISRQAKHIRTAERETRKLSAAQRGLNDSTNHLIRSYVSVFAIMGATHHINRVGQGFESLNSSMLAAMGTTEEAAKQIEFLDQMTDRLGLSLLDTGDQYTKFVFASKGKLPTEEVNLLFTGMAELGTTLGISKERMKLSFTAIQQINIIQGLPNK